MISGTPMAPSSKAFPPKPWISHCQPVWRLVSARLKAPRQVQWLPDFQANLCRNIWGYPRLKYVCMCSMQAIGFLQSLACLFQHVADAADEKSQSTSAQGPQSTSKPHLSLVIALAKRIQWNHKGVLHTAHLPSHRRTIWHVRKEASR